MYVRERGRKKEKTRDYLNIAQNWMESIQMLIALLFIRNSRYGQDCISHMKSVLLIKTDLLFCPLDTYDVIKYTNRPNKQSTKQYHYILRLPLTRS